MTKRIEITAALPIVFGLRRTEAAASVGVSATTFDKMVAAGTMPRPRRAHDGVWVWDVDELRTSFKALPRRDDGAEEEPGNSWDDL